MPPPQLPKIDRSLYNQGSSKGSNGSGGRLQYPDQIVCCVCNRAKKQGEFSTRQLNNWKATIYSPFAPGGRVKGTPRTTCKKCTPSQTTELTCSCCGETFGLDSFAKTQRKRPDTARCKKCIRIQADTARDLDVPDSDDYDESDDEEEQGDFDTLTVVDKSSMAPRTAATSAYAASVSNGGSSTTSSQLSNEHKPADPDDGWVTKGSARQPFGNKQAENSFGQSRGSSQAGGSTSGGGTSEALGESSYSDFGTIRSGNQNQSNLGSKNWAKVEKVKKKGAAPKKGRGHDEDDDEEDGNYDDDANSQFSSGGWTDRKQRLKADFDSDPWSARYR